MPTASAANRRPGARNAQRAGERCAFAALEPPDGPVRVDGRDLLAACVVRRAVLADDLVDRAEPRHESLDLRRPLRRAGGDPRALLGAERGKREADRREVGAGVERVAHLLEDQRLLDEAEADAALVLRERDAEPAELGELAPAVVLRRVEVAVERIALGEPRARGVLQLLLFLCQREVHGYRPFGRPSTRSATMLRRTSDVPASIVLPRLRSCW